MKKLKTPIIILLSLFAAFFLHSFIIDPILIPDPCYYHSNEASFLINSLYDFPASEGFHPVWNWKYYLLIIMTGLGISFLKPLKSASSAQIS